MDKVRLGRALGYGTRHAVRTVAAVVEAATATAPRQPTQSVSPSQARAVAEPSVLDPGPRPAAPVTAPSARPRRGRTRQASKALWAPLATYSNALWHRVTGLFFAMVAVVMAGGAWRQRGAVLHGAASSGSAERFWLFLGLVALFGYFAVSGFVRAARRERSSA